MSGPRDRAVGAGPFPAIFGIPSPDFRRHIGFWFGHVALAFHMRIEFAENQQEIAARLKERLSEMVQINLNDTRIATSIRPQEGCTIDRRASQG